MALLEDNSEFVKLFLENDVDLKKFLTHQSLLSLYNKVGIFLYAYS
jgi:hypothetical protein